MVLAFTGLRWEEAVAVSIENVDLRPSVDATRSLMAAHSGAKGCAPRERQVNIAVSPESALPLKTSVRLVAAVSGGSSWRLRLVAVSVARGRGGRRRCRDGYRREPAVVR